ncbi:ATP-binding protein [Microbacterium sp. LS_15]|uniref:AAA family ATPase n=1 Tax=Microbacterium sp. LS_15 TaxID=3055790 RepID=UPI0035BF6608
MEALALPGPAAVSPLRGTAPAPAIDGAWARIIEDAPDVVLAPELSAQVELLISEHASAAELSGFGLTPSRTVLFTGPPGVGKTVTAAHVAARLQVPLITVNFATLISSLMGKTGSNFQELVDSAHEAGAVLFLDEFDAIAKSRGDQQDLGEMKRVVNVVLQQLDAWPAGRLLIAATNHPELLDNAIFRRFDAEIAFCAPGPEERRRFLDAHDVLDRLAVAAATREAMALSFEGETLSTLDVWVKTATRRIVLGGRTSAASEELLAAITTDARRRATQSADVRAGLARAAHAMGWTQRRTADWLGVSHVTIGNDLRGQ